MKMKERTIHNIWIQALTIIGFCIGYFYIAPRLFDSKPHVVATAPLDYPHTCECFK